MKLRNTFLLLSFWVLISLLSGCQGSNLQGLYIQEGSSDLEVMLIKNDGGYDFIAKDRKPIRFKGKETLTFKNQVIKVLEDDKILFSLKGASVGITFKRVKENNIPFKRWALFMGIEKEKVLNLFVRPDTIVTTASNASKLFYPNDIALVFGEEGLIKVVDNHKAHRDFSKIQVGMDKAVVVEILGSPDRESGNKAEKKLHYGLDKFVVLSNEVVIRIYEK